MLSILSGRSLYSSHLNYYLGMHSAYYDHDSQEYLHLWANPIEILGFRKKSALYDAFLGYMYWMKIIVRYHNQIRIEHLGFLILH